MHAEATFTLHRPLVLVVDDQPFFRAQMRTELARRGYTVVTAQEADEAAALVEQLGPPLVVLLDLMLPGTSGPELLQTLSRRQDAHQLRFVLVSAHEVVTRVALENHLVVARLEKPVDLDQLTGHLDAAGTALAGADGLR